MAMNDGGVRTQFLYAWLAKDGDGVEGIVAVPHPQTGVLPLVMSSEQLAKAYAPQVRVAVQARQQTARLVRFQRGLTLDQITPQ